MKRVLLILTLVTMNTVNANTVECKKDGRYWRPSNALAVKIAKSLGVKTCNGKRFKAVVAGIGAKSNVKATAKKMSVAQLIKSLK